MTLEELDHTLPNGFHDAKIFSFQIDSVRGIATFHLNLLVGWPDDPEPGRGAYQKATLVVRGLCLFSIDPPDFKYPFLPGGKPILVTGSSPKPGAAPFVPELLAKFPTGTWSYLFYVDDWNSCINIAAHDATVTWIGEKPKHAASPL
jgi:hypothetical protein